MRATKFGRKIVTLIDISIFSTVWLEVCVSPGKLRAVKEVRRSAPGSSFMVSMRARSPLLVTCSERKVHIWYSYIKFHCLPVRITNLSSYNRRRSYAAPSPNLRGLACNNYLSTSIRSGSDRFSEKIRWASRSVVPKPYRRSRNRAPTSPISPNPRYQHFAHMCA